ncbi:4-hydroxy-tetrahydrodipicolinate synthase [Oscillatoria salina]|uniref:4-hydroxy-tetrahydrodipicolinate synthase n=1 Tax=Oscillatoria salina TaxID=331517 RepID=UPI0013BBD699|nr:4-hydroxy-tetrahydrodipicolinate synthase [Oscillatoria salina]MBZ8182039.1 4-hydroxy-tetrahydrodipicolinate synthase [Oscillatoria salina IIICB1]NET89812.1 4-hydroxy-tetrahydrodipicolinate synthase [Kamptonema sp. SIO1D9]
MTVELFGRVITAMVTPFAEDGSVDYGVAEKLAAHLAENGSDGILVCGTTGESPTLTWSEEYQLFQVVQKAVRGKAKVIAGTGSNSTREAIAATQKAAKLGLDGSLQVVPYYNKPPQAGLELHFRSIALACPDLPIMLYNIPSRTGQNLQPETVAKLAEIDNIVAIKEASGNLDNVSQIRVNTSESFGIYSGDDNLTLPILSVGGTGVISVASHLVGDKLQKAIGNFVVGKTAEASKIHGELLSLFKALFCITNPIPIKAALTMQGWNVGSVRPPLCEIPPDLKAKLEKVLQELALL